MNIKKKIKNDYTNSKYQDIDEYDLYQKIKSNLNLKNDNEEIKIVKNRKIMILSFSLVCLLIVITLPFILNKEKVNKYYSYLVLEVNPKISIVTDENNKVLAVKGLNDEGRKIVYNEEFSSDDLKDVVNHLLEKESLNSYNIEDAKIYYSTLNNNYDSYLKSKFKEIEIIKEQAINVDESNWNNHLKTLSEIMIETKDLITSELENCYFEAKIIYEEINKRNNLTFDFLYQTYYQTLVSLLEGLESLRLNYLLDKYQYELEIKDLQIRIEDYQNELEHSSILLKLLEEQLEAKIKFFTEFTKKIESEYKKWQSDLTDCINKLKEYESKEEISYNQEIDFDIFKEDFFITYQSYIIEILK